MNYLVAGTGYTGKRVLAALQRSGSRCVGIGRRARPEIGAGFYHVRDLDSVSPEPVALTGPYRLLYTIPPAAEAAKDIRLSRLLEMLDPHPTRIVYLSTSGVYGDRQGALTDEQVLPTPTSDRAKRRWEAEKRVLSFCGNTDSEAIILRVPGIYGPQRLGMQRIQSSAPVLRQSDANPGNRIHVDDLARCCIAALQNQVPAGVYNVGDGDFRSGSWFTATVAALSGHQPPPQISREEARRTFTEKRLSFLRESRRLDTRKMHEVLGVLPRYADAAEGIRASLAADGLLREQ